MTTRPIYVTTNHELDENLTKAEVGFFLDLSTRPETIEAMKI